MYYYSIIAQFAKANAPSFREEPINCLIQQAVSHFNSKSALASNPKKILEINVKDNFNLEIIFESTLELDEAVASRALRVFSMYLISDAVEGNLSHLIVGKRLFKMLPKKIEHYTTTPQGATAAPQPIAVPVQQEYTSAVSRGNCLKQSQGDPIENVTFDGVLLIGQFCQLLLESETDNRKKRYVYRIQQLLHRSQQRLEDFLQ